MKIILRWWCKKTRVKMTRDDDVRWLREVRVLNVEIEREIERDVKRGKSKTTMYCSWEREVEKTTVIQ